MLTLETIPAGSTRRWIKQQPPQFLPFRRPTLLISYLVYFHRPPALYLQRNRPPDNYGMVIYARALAGILELRYYYRYRSLVVLFVSLAWVLHACIIVVDKGSVYRKYISSFAVLLYLVLKIRSYLKILFPRSQNPTLISII